ncbi:MAG: cytochrome c family protein [Gemmataceae bacterium]
MLQQNGTRLVGLLALAALVVGLVYDAVAQTPPAAPPPESGAWPSVGGTKVFSTWPAGRPEAVLILSGQTFGFLSPCGCSRPQTGGLERRANLVSRLKAKGWPVAGVDLGDFYPAKSAVKEQGLLKYVTGMNALREMGYLAVGVGKNEFDGDLLQVVAAYALQKERAPFSLGGNIAGKAGDAVIPREQYFPPAPDGKRPLVGLTEVADVGGVPVGVAGVVGPSVAKAVEGSAAGFGFLGNKDVLDAAVKELAAHPKRPKLNVLLYQGTADEARKVIADRPEFQVVLCQADDPEPPQYPELIGKTLLVQVGHKGRYVGALGVFRKADGSLDLQYQLVPLGEEFLTPEGDEAAKGNAVLGLLEDYTKQVKERNFLAKVARTPHSAQLQKPELNLSFVGSERCLGCHAGEFAKWKDSKHGHAYEGLEVYAKRPGNRQFDPECIVCHTVGYGVKTGFESTEKTPALKDVGCESCHGPGSGHMSAPRDADLLKLLSPWKLTPTDRLPDVATFERIAKAPVGGPGGLTDLPAAQQRIVNAVSQACTKCHDHENDPHFDLAKYWPKVVHGAGKK